MDSHWKVDPVLILLFFGMVLFTSILIFVDWHFKDDGQIFQVISGLDTGFAGAFFTRLKPRTDAEEKGQVETSRTVTVAAAKPPEEPSAK